LCFTVASRAQADVVESSIRALIDDGVIDSTIKSTAICVKDSVSVYGSFINEYKGVSFDYVDNCSINMSDKVLLVLHGLPLENESIGYVRYVFFPQHGVDKLYGEVVFIPGKNGFDFSDLTKGSVVH